MFKIQHNESLYVKCVTVTETVFTTRTVVREIFIKDCHTEMHKNSTVCLGADFM